MAEPVSPRLQALVATALGESHADKQGVVFAALVAEWVSSKDDLADYKTEEEIHGLVLSLFKEHEIPTRITRRLFLKQAPPPPPPPPPVAPPVPLVSAVYGPVQKKMKLAGFKREPVVKANFPWRIFNVNELMKDKSGYKSFMNVENVHVFAFAFLWDKQQRWGLCEKRWNVCCKTLALAKKNIDKKGGLKAVAKRFMSKAHMQAINIGSTSVADLEQTLRDLDKLGSSIQKEATETNC